MISPARFIRSISLWGAAFAVLAPGFVSAQKTAASPEKYDPVADPAAVVTVGRARFTVLTPRMIRMEWAADGKFEDRASFVFLQRNLPVPQFMKTAHGDGVEIKTSALELKYTPKGDGRFTEDSLQISFELDGQMVMWHAGEEDKGNLGGTTRTLDGALGAKTREPIGPGLISRDGWVVVDDSTRPLFDSADFSFPQGESSPWPWAVERPAGERQDWYFFGYGHEYKQALGDYVKVAGRIPLPPRFAFGAWWSRYWAYSDQELKELVAGFRENSVPLDVFVIDMDWHPIYKSTWFAPKQDQSGHTLGWSGYSWNRLLFPDPDAFLQDLHDDGLKVTLNLHPASGVQPFEDAYPAMARAMGQDPAEKKYVPFDITSKKFAQNYFDILHHPLEKQGIDFWWLDWQQEAETKMAGVNPTWWLNYAHFTDQEREGKRPLLFHRWGGLGNHRYQIGFSGDSISVWESLAFQPGFTAQAANVGYAYWSHDIGGHQPGPVDAELYLRWLQFGTFSPILRTHTTKNPESERRIWAYPEPYSDMMKQMFQLRYALQPYIYTEARRTYDTGVAFLRPLYYDWPDAPEAYTHSGEYIFGEAMLVAPITHPVDATKQTAEQTVWLPKGEWFEVDTGRKIQGPVTVTHDFTLDDVPLYVKAGAIVPMQPPMEFTGQKPVDPLILHISPAETSDATYQLYEDGSDARNYETGEFATTGLHAAHMGAETVVRIDPVKGSYKGMLKERAYMLVLPGDWPPASVTVNGKALKYSRVDGTVGWRYNGNQLATTVLTERFATSKAVEIRVKISPELAARRAELQGFAGVMTRLRLSYNELNQTWPLSWSPDQLVDAMQTGNRLSYYPEHASAELKRFPDVLKKAQTAVDSPTESMDPDEARRIAKRMGVDPDSDAAKKRFAQIQENFSRGDALLGAAVEDSAGGK